MSYEIIKSISFKDNKVNITSYCNNVFPKTPSKWFCESLTKLLEEKGKDEVIKEILLEFWKGNFQGQSTDYGKAQECFKSEKDYNWDNVGKVVGEKQYEWSDNIVKYSYQELKEELFKHFLEYKKKTTKKNLYFVKFKNTNDFISGLTSRKATVTNWEESAKKFTLAQVENIKLRFSSYEFEIIGV